MNVNEMMELTTIVIEDTEGFLRLRDTWRDIMADSDASVFSSWEWLFPWWKYFGKGRDFFILVLFSGKLPVAIFPHYISRHRLLFMRDVGIIHTIGSDVTATDYLDFPIRRGMEEAALSRWIDYLMDRKREWSLVEIKDIAGQSPQYPLIIDAARSAGIITHESVKDRIPFAVTEPEHIARRKLEKKALRRLSEYERSFSRHHHYRFGTGAVNGDLERTFEIFLTLHARRSTKTGRQTKLTTPPFSDFLYEACRLFDEVGRLFFTWISVGGEIAAIHLNFVMNGRLYYYNAGMDERWGKYRAGLILFSHEMAHAKQWGIDEYLFLRGNEDYKYLWAEDEHHLMLAHLTRPGVNRLLVSADLSIRSIMGKISGNG
jgi:hypothetical protein